MYAVLRRFEPEDVYWLVASHGELYASQFSFDSDFLKDIKHKVTSFLGNEDDFSRFYIAEAGSERVGSVAVSLRPEGFAFINFLMVREPFQGHGIAKQLIDKVLIHCRENGVDCVRLETYSCLRAARQLYGSFGFSMYDRNCDIKKYGQTFDQEFWQKLLVD